MRIITATLTVLAALISAVGVLLFFDAAYFLATHPELFSIVSLDLGLALVLSVALYVILNWRKS